MLFDAVINGVVIPVEVSDEELRKKGYTPENDSYDRGKMDVKLAIIERLVHDMELEEYQSDALACNFTYDGKVDTWISLSEDTFADLLVRGVLAEEIKDVIEELAPKYRTFLVSADIGCTLEFAVKAKDESEAQDAIYNTDAEYLFNEWVNVHGYPTLDIECVSIQGQVDPLDEDLVYNPVMEDFE